MENETKKKTTTVAIDKDKLELIKKVRSELKLKNTLSDILINSSLMWMEILFIASTGKTLSELLSVGEVKQTEELDVLISDEQKELLKCRIAELITYSYSISLQENKVLEFLDSYDLKALSIQRLFKNRDLEDVNKSSTLAYWKSQNDEFIVDDEYVKMRKGSTSSVYRINSLLDNLITLSAKDNNITKAEDIERRLFYTFANDKELNIVKPSELKEFQNVSHNLAKGLSNIHQLYLHFNRYFKLNTNEISEETFNELNSTLNYLKEQIDLLIGVYKNIFHHYQNLNDRIAYDVKSIKEQLDELDKNMKENSSSD